MQVKSASFIYYITVHFSCSPPPSVVVFVPVSMPASLDPSSPMCRTSTDRFTYKIFETTSTIPTSCSENAQFRSVVLLSNNFL